MDKKIAPWRLNYVIDYNDIGALHAYRETILAILKNVARLRGIECAIQSPATSHDDVCLPNSQFQEDSLFDLVYFRHGQPTTISRSEFRKMLDHIFEPYKCKCFDRVEVCAQLLSALPKFPFPEHIPEPPSTLSRFVVKTSKLPS